MKMIMLQLSQWLCDDFSQTWTCAYVLVSSSSSLINVNHFEDSEHSRLPFDKTDLVSWMISRV